MTPFLLSFNVISRGISLQIESILWESTSGSGFIKKVKLNLKKILNDFLKISSGDAFRWMILYLKHLDLST